jgi:serine/threonine protein kinase/ABC-type phosphate/phosphonate transport system substrate-binding protein
MTNHSVNFSFLADISPDLDLLHCFAFQAEMYLHSDPNSCLIKIRQFGELLAQEIAARNGESIDLGESQHDLLCRLKNKGILRHRSSNLFHKIREEGNQANHSGLNDYDRALNRLKDAHQLARWFYNTHVNGRELNTFTLPQNLLIKWETNTQKLSVSKEINQSLAERLTEQELQLNELSKAETNKGGVIDQQLAEIKELRKLLAQELREKEAINKRLEEIQQQAVQMTPTQKQATILRSHQQEDNIMARVKIDALEVGTLLRDRYEIVKQLGIGSFGVTYVAKDRDFPGQKEFVIKQFNPVNIEQKSVDIARAKFEQEAECLARLNNDFIPRVYAQFEENGHFYIVQDLVEGVTLSQELKAGDKKNEQYIKKLLVDVLTPLAYVHQQDIIHRDLKPDNLIRRNDDGKISLIDFGAVKEVVNQPTSQAGTTIGTPGYMPHEQVSGRPKMSSDIYAVGVIAIQASTGIDLPQLSFDHDENLIWQDLAPDISLELKNVLSQMVEYDFRKRYVSAGEALQALILLDTEEQAEAECLRNQVETEKLQEQAEDKKLQEQVETKRTQEQSEVKQLPERDKAERSKKQPETKHFKIIGSLVGLVILGIGIKSWDYLTKPKISNSTIVVGILTNPSDYRELGDYLRKELVPANYFDYLQGKQVGIVIEGDKSLSYQEVKKRLADKKWDIAFARSPMISRFAQKQGYSYLAGMFPGSASYQSGIFVKANSPIRSINDIKPTTIVALGDFNSASSFYMPAYNLYGKTFLAKIAHGDSPMSMVAQGKAEVGATAIGDKIKSNNSAFRIIHTSRAIPGSGVYLSPQLAPEHQQIQRVLLAAPKSIRSLKKANYDDVPEANYTEFDKITERVDSIIECVDFDKNPVNLFCDKSANQITK